MAGRRLTSLTITPSLYVLTFDQLSPFVVNYNVIHVHLFLLLMQASFNAEDLNQEMANLEGLMKDLNALKPNGGQMEPC